MSEPLPIYDWMSPAERATRHRKNTPPVAKKSRPYQLHVELTAAEEADLAKLPLHERVAQFRRIRDERGTV